MPYLVDMHYKLLQSDNGPKISPHTPGLEQQTPVDPQKQEFIRALALMRKNINNSDFTLEAAAKQQYCSARSLQRVFERQQTTFRDQLVGLRMRHARKLLLETKLTIAQIAEKVGYSMEHSMHFSRAFKKFYGISPRDCRREAGLPARTVN